MTWVAIKGRWCQDGHPLSRDGHLREALQVMATAQETRVAFDVILFITGLSPDIY